VPLPQRPPLAPASGDDPVPAVRAVDAVKSYGEGPVATRALDGLSVDIGSGRFTAIMGPSGSGKSTLLHCVGGLDTLSAGRVFLGGTDLGTLDDDALTRVRRERVGFIFQSFNLLPALTAAENIALPMAIRGRTADRAWLNELVATVGIADRLDHTPAQLSGGECQRVAAVRALVGRPEIVLADEPTGNLDTNASAQLLAFLRGAVTASGQTVVMVTHDPVAASCADRVLFLVDGRLVGKLDHPDPGSVLEAMKGLSS
jgi:putative ABC transport system ATP-binding protein